METNPPRAFHSSIPLKDGRLLIYAGIIADVPSFVYDFHYEIFSTWAAQTPTVTGYSGPFTWSQVGGSGTLYSNGFYIPNQTRAETAKIEAKGASGCVSDFEITTN